MFIPNLPPNDTQAFFFSSSFGNPEFFLFTFACSDGGAPRLASHLTGIPSVGFLFSFSLSFFWWAHRRLFLPSMAGAQLEESAFGAFPLAHATVSQSSLLYHDAGDEGWRFEASLLACSVSLSLSLFSDGNGTDAAPMYFRTPFPRHPEM